MKFSESKPFLIKGFIRAYIKVTLVILPFFIV